MVVQERIHKNTERSSKMIDLTYKSYTNKDYLVDEINSKIKTDKKQLRKLNKNTLLDILSYTSK